MTIGRDDLSKSLTVTVAAIETGVPLLVEARDIIAAFQAMIRKKSLADLEPWLERARSSLVTNTERPHQGRGMNGRPALKAFTDGLKRLPQHHRKTDWRTADKKPETGFNAFRNQRRLTPAQIAALSGEYRFCTCRDACSSSGF